LAIVTRRRAAIHEILTRRFQAPTPSLLAIAQEVVARGISLRSALAVLDRRASRTDSDGRHHRWTSPGSKHSRPRPALGTWPPLFDAKVTVQA